MTEKNTGKILCGRWVTLYSVVKQEKDLVTHSMFMAEAITPGGCHAGGENGFVRDPRSFQNSL